MRRAALIGVVLAAGCAPTPFVPPPPSPQRVYGVSEVDERPEIVMMPPLPYPAGGGDGVVVIRVVIDSAGNPEPASAVIVQGTDSLLVAAARALVVSTLFRPGRVRGRVVQTLVELPVEFSAASVPPVTLHMAGDVYRDAELAIRGFCHPPPPGQPVRSPRPAGARGAVARGERRRVLRTARAIGLREDHGAPLHRRARGAQRRGSPDRRARRHASRPRRARRRDGVPDARAVPASHRAAQHRLRTGSAARAGRRNRPAGAAGRRPARARHAARPPARRALGRRAPARGAGRRPGARAPA